GDDNTCASSVPRVSNRLCAFKTRTPSFFQESVGFRAVTLQYLRLGSCSDTTQQWADFSSALEINQSLKCLDLTASEFPDEGVKLLCSTLRHPVCFLLKFVGLWGCSITPFSCQDLASALISKQSPEALDLGQDILGPSGVVVLLEALTQKNGPLKTFGLKIDTSTMEIWKLLKDVKESNPQVTAECNKARTARSSGCDSLS
uniref:Uncharacterized protein n=1 Tax=Phocoena sinus TaxID=42100 RepID=A0A8C9C7W8_PHOSS